MPRILENRRFQSTPLMRGETSTRLARSTSSTFQSTPLMRGETIVQALFVALRIISIHSPRARGDRDQCERPQGVHHFNPLPSCEGRLPYLVDVEPSQIFQSTPLVRGETKAAGEALNQLKISIHSPRARGDARGADCAHLCGKISIHSPRARGDQPEMIGSEGGENFNPLPSCEGRLK